MCASRRFLERVHQLLLLLQDPDIVHPCDSSNQQASIKGKCAASLNEADLAALNIPTDAVVRAPSCAYATPPCLHTCGSVIH